MFSDKSVQLRGLRKQVKLSKKAAFAEGTRVNLNIQWMTFISFCIYFELPWLPTTADVICLYAQFLSQTFKAPASIRNYICGVKTLHVLTDTQTLIFDTVELRLAIKGLARLNPHCPKRAAPITPEILLAIHAILDFSNVQHTVFWSIFLLAFFTFARKSNLVASGKVSHQLLRENITVGSKGMLVTFKWTKTIQFGQRQLVVPVVSIPNSPLCPVLAYRRMCSRVPASSVGPAFVLPSSCKSHVYPVTYTQYQKFLRRVIQIIGFNPGDFSSHSFRRGGATWAFRCKVPGELVKVHGDWASDAYLKYLDFSLDQRLEVARTMVASLP